MFRHLELCLFNLNLVKLRDLSSNHTVIIFNYRGVGNTTTDTTTFSMIQFANDTAGLLDALKIQKADILGYSMGSLVAQDLTLLHPDKVNRLILVASSCGGEENIPRSPDVVKISSDFAYNRSQDVGKLLSHFRNHGSDHILIIYPFHNQKK
jgi:pimeloyl-ACP methyl ester carboxylesterase